MLDQSIAIGILLYTTTGITQIGETRDSAMMSDGWGVGVTWQYFTIGMLVKNATAGR